MRIGALILSVFLLVVQFRMTLVQLDYVVHKDYIIAELCIEREVENSTCDGKCHLTKELAKVDLEKDADDQRSPTRVQLEDLRFVDSQSTEGSDIEQASTFSSYSLFSFQNTSNGFYSIDRPPPELS